MPNCPICDGAGTVNEKSPCHLCGGMRRVSDSEALRYHLTMEMGEYFYGYPDEADER